MKAIVGQVVRAVLTAVLGVTLGFVAAASVFADGTRDERRVTIAALLLAYGLCGAALGFRPSSWYGLGLALSGVAALVWFGLVGDRHWWYMLYGALIVAFAVGGAYGTTALFARRRAAGGTTV